MDGSQLAGDIRSAGSAEPRGRVAAWPHPPLTRKGVAPRSSESSGAPDRTRTRGNDTHSNTDPVVCEHHGRERLTWRAALDARGRLRRGIER